MLEAKVTADLPYHSLAYACLLIALDNGGINRGRSLRKWKGDYRRWVERQAAPLTEISRWLGVLSEAQIETLCAGEATEAEAVAQDAPAFTQDLLNRYFEEVC